MTSTSQSVRWGVALAATAVASFALGAWIFHHPSPIAAAGPVAARAAKPAMPLASGPSRPASVAPALDLVDGSARELEQALRARLGDSVDDVLRSLRDIGRERPALAIELAQSLGRTPEEKSEWVTNAMQQWADRDGQGAWEWLRGLSAEHMEDLAGGSLTKVVLATMAAQDPARVVQNLDSLLRDGNSSASVPTPIALHAGLDALVENGGLERAKAAIEAWAHGPQAASIEAADFSAVAIAMSKTSPETAAAWLLAQQASEERSGAVAAFADVWAGRNPLAALAWAETLSADEKQKAMGRVVSDWVESRPGEVSAWLGDYLSRAPADGAADHLVETVINLSPEVKNDPQTALQWTALISEPAQREAYAERTALRWARRDQTAAANFVQTSTLIPAERKAAVLQMLAIGTAANAMEE